MYIQEQYENLDLIKCEMVQEILRDGSSRLREVPILAEHLIEVYINGSLAMKITCTAQYLAELLLGRLLTEGYIENEKEVKSIRIDESGGCGRVMLKDKERKFLPFVSWKEDREAKPIESLSWKKEWIFALADRFAEGMPLHGKTWATHSCFLSSEGEILFGCEDIGRHNAFDKVIGYALRNQINLKKCVVYLSGRIPKDMAMKAIKAGIPVLAAKAVPTKEAVRLAKKYGLTLIYSARKDSMRVV